MRAKNALRFGLVALFTAGMSVSGCGSDYVPVGTGGKITAYGGGAAEDAAGSFGFDSGSLAPPGCGVGPDGGVCDCIDTPLLVDPPTFYFVLDRSGSMTDADKWNTVRAAVSEIVSSVGPRAKFGATVFPGKAGTCDRGVEIMSIRNGDSPSGTFGPTNKFLVETTRALQAYGGTPTAPTLDALVTPLGQNPGKTYVILATDGGPNCSGATCGAESCILNIEGVDGCRPNGPSCCVDQAGLCLDGDATISAISRLKSANVPTFVIGVPGSQTYSNLLDRMAQAGGTAQQGAPAYYRVDKADKADLVAALRKVAAKIVATCTYDLREAPPDVNKLNVYLDEKVVPKDPTNGWKVDGKTVTLLGDTCDKVLRGDVLGVRIILGCPTIEAR